MSDPLLRPEAAQGFPGAPVPGFIPTSAQIRCYKLTCDEINLMRERWNLPPRSTIARFSPYQEPIITPPLKIVRAMASSRAEGCRSTRSSSRNRLVNRKGLKRPGTEIIKGGIQRSAYAKLQRSFAAQFVAVCCNQPFQGNSRNKAAASNPKIPCPSTRTRSPSMGAAS